MGADLPGLARMRYDRGERQAEKVQRPEDDPQKLFTEACLHGLRARLYDDVDSLDSYLPPLVAELARKVPASWRSRSLPPRDVSCRRRDAYRGSCRMRHR